MYWIILTIIAAVVHVISYFIPEDNYGNRHLWALRINFISLIAIVVFLIMCFLNTQINLGETQLTGYIYSAEDLFGDSTVGHIRFSESAGADTQPSFCVKKADGQQIKELAGSGKKVKVTIPAGVVNAWRWDCELPAIIEIMEDV